MKPKIHPNYHEITIKMTNGKTFKTRSTWGKEGDVLQLDVDPNTHPAWTGNSAHVNENANRIAKFKERFGGFDLSLMGAAKPKAEGQAAPAAPKEAAPAAPKAAEKKDKKKK